MDGSGLFVGLITYGGSTFNRHGEATHTIGRIEAAMAAQGLACTSLISDRDDYSADVFPITRSRLLSSALFQAWLEFRWRRYLARGRADSLSSLPRDAAVLAVMSARRLHSYLGFNPFRAAARLPGARQVIRLLNIDLSHLRVYRAALQSDAVGVLVIEDDARLIDGEAPFEVLQLLLSTLQADKSEFVNLSESISQAELGVSGILGAPKFPEGFEGIAIIACSRPVTNTVCANLFSRRFVEMLVSDIEKRGLFPVIPIDWRLNRMIMEEWKSGGLNSTICTWTTPGIFVQGSMHPAGSS